MRFQPPFVFALLAAVPAAVGAQSPLLPQHPLTAQQRPARALVSRNQIVLELGVLAGGLSYARRLGDTQLSVGVGVWGAWEPPNTFDRNFWEPLGGSVFGRYRPLSWLHGDVGITAARYLWADDCSECTGTLIALRSAVLVGYRFLFVGPEVSIGQVSDDRNGSDVGAIWGAQLRVLLGW